MKSPSILFGATSLLGFTLANMFPHTLLPFISPGNPARAVRQWPALQLDNPGWIDALFQQVQPEILLYAHAVCDVPKCEANPDWAFKINVEQLARVIAALPEQTRLVYVSSDHVFGGDGIYSEASPLCPISTYGRTRLEAERLVLARPGSLVIRAGLGIGRSPNGRTGHLDWLRYRTENQLPITIIQDECRSAVWIHDLAQRVMALARSMESGIRHIPARRAVSRVKLARSLLERMGLDGAMTIESRHQQPVPHLGSVELVSMYQGELVRPLPSVLEVSPVWFSELAPHQKGNAAVL